LKILDFSILVNVVEAAGLATVVASLGTVAGQIRVLAFH
jgi:hypothetical protein